MDVVRNIILFRLFETSTTVQAITTKLFSVDNNFFYIQSQTIACFFNLSTFDQLIQYVLHMIIRMLVQNFA